MRRKQNIQDAFKSIVPELAAGVWSVGYSGHTDMSGTLIVSGVTITAIRNITDNFVPVTGSAIMNDVYVDYTVTGGGSYTISIYNYPTTTTTTTIAPTTTTTTT